MRLQPPPYVPTLMMVLVSTFVPSSSSIFHGLPAVSVTLTDTTASISFFCGTSVHFTLVGWPESLSLDLSPPGGCCSPNFCYRSSLARITSIVVLAAGMHFQLSPSLCSANFCAYTGRRLWRCPQTRHTIIPLALDPAFSGVGFLCFVSPSLRITRLSPSSQAISPSHNNSSHSSSWSSTP